MAKNWLMGEAARAIRNNEKEAILDFGKRFPLTTVLLAQLNEAGIAVCDALPAKVTMRKIEMSLKGEVDETEVEPGETAEVADEVIEEKEEAPAKKERKKKSKKDRKKNKKAADPEPETDEEEEEPAPKKEKKAKKAKKEKKVVEPEPEDDDDDFDFDLDDDDE